MKKLLLVLLTLCVYTTSEAAVRLPSILSDGVVLQQNSQVRLWGWGSPHAKLSIIPSWQKDTLRLRVGPDGKWSTTVQTPKAGGPYTIDFNENNHLQLKNVWLGEVWVCSGQSNMEFTYNWRKTKDVAADFPTCGKYQLHFFQIPKTTALAPQENCEGSWTACDSNTVKNFSAVAYFFGKILHQNLNVPIGLISTNWGGTPAEVWTPESLVNKNPYLKEWQEKIKPSIGWPIKAGRTYNAMIYPITPFKIAGTIWYQGESNVDTYQSYGQLFKTMINAWRMSWNSDFPFYFVQIAPFSYGTKDAGAALREQQAVALSLPHTGMVVTADLAPDTSDIHPHDKHDVGYRLGYLALSEHYGQPDMARISPIYTAYKLKGSQVVIELSHASKGITSRDGKVRDLYMAGADGILYPAEAKLEKGQITVSSGDVKTPKLVQYGYDNTRMGNLFNQDGLPVAPFRIEVK